MFAALALIGVLASGAPVPPAPARWVDDAHAFMTSARRQALDAKLEAYEHQTGHQIVVWIGDTIGGAALDDFAVRTFAAWQLGHKGKDDGLAIFVLAADRKIDIEVGYGLEPVVPDIVAKRIIDDVMVPRLRADDRDGAIENGVDAVLASIEGKPFHATAMPHAATSWSTGQIVGGALVLVAIVIFGILNPRGLMWLLMFAMGRGSGGGNGGGFSGGGGRSGGGGARGGW